MFKKTEKIRNLWLYNFRKQMSMKRISVYPGSFDPFTYGHLDMLLSAVKLFDTVHVGVLMNNAKVPSFTTSERVGMINNVIKQYSLDNVIVDEFDGLLVDYVRKIKAGYIIRGLRAITDFEYEFQMDAINKFLEPSVQTLYFMAKKEHSFLSSSTVREICSFGGDITEFVPQCNIKFIKERLNKKQ